MGSNRVGFWGRYVHSVMNQTEYTSTGLGANKYTVVSGLRKHEVESFDPRASNEDEQKRADKRHAYISGNSNKLPFSRVYYFNPFAWVYYAVSGLRGLIQRDVDFYAIEREEKIQANILKTYGTQTKYENNRIDTAKPDTPQGIDDVRRMAASDYKSFGTKEILKSQKRARIIKGIWAAVFLVPEAVLYATAHPILALKGAGELIGDGLSKLFPGLMKKKNSANKYTSHRSESTREVNRKLTHASNIEMSEMKKSKTRNISKSPNKQDSVPAVASLTLASASLTPSQQRAVSQERKESESSTSLESAAQEAVSAARAAASAVEESVKPDISLDQIQLEEPTQPAHVVTIHGRNKKKKTNIVSGSLTIIRPKNNKPPVTLDNDNADPDSVLHYHPNHRHESGG